MTPNPEVMLQFLLDATRPADHLILVQLEMAVEASMLGSDGSIEFFLPTWTPGSYLIREFARHLSRVTAADEHGQLPCEKVTKNRFRVVLRAPGRLRLHYKVYAHELSVRTCHLDDSHAFWNHAGVLLWPRGRNDLPATLTVRYPAQWRVTCALPTEPAPQPSQTDHREQRFVAKDLDAAIDAPVLVGTGERLDFEVLGVPHTIVLDGLASVKVPEHLAADLGRIVRAAAAVFGGTLPYDRYAFMALFTDEGYGGLEHSECSVLLQSRTQLASDRGYREFLALAAHELFHAWNVKRMRPEEFWSYDYERENYSRLLWLMEGWTAYFDDLLVARAGLMSLDDYLAALSKNLQGLLTSPGRFEASLSESSHDAWIRLYRPDENTRNSSQNYYGNGAIAALCLDLTLRSSGQDSLDKVIRLLFERSWRQGIGFRYEHVDAILREVGGEPMGSLLHSLVEGTLDPDLDSLLNSVGLLLRQPEPDPALGVTFQRDGTTIASVIAGSPAAAAGISAGDELLALDELRVTAGNWKNVFGALARPSGTIRVLLARRGVLRQTDVALGGAALPHQIRTDPNATDDAVERRAAWLRGPAVTD